MASTAHAVRKALRGLEDGLAVFTTQLATEAAELRRNVEQRPCTGATFYRNCLHDLAERLEGVGEELAALEAVSSEAVSLEELVGHSVALYCQNHIQVQELEAQLAQFGYRDLYAPLPPENPLDMLELSGGGRRAAAAAAAEEENEEEEGQCPAYDEYTADGCDAGSPPAAAGGEALGEVTNRLAAAQLGERAADCEASPQGDARQQARWGGGGAAPRTTLKAMAPMTAAKALMRADTPSSLASPEAMSPSMRELLGKYAASSAGGGTQPRASSADLPSEGTPGGSGGAPPPSPVPSYLSPAFQLAAMEQEVHMAHAAAAAGSGGAAGSPISEAWQADDAMYSALTATARKLAGKPSFMDAYRQKFPAIVASTERLLQTVEKQRRPAAAAAVAAEEAAAGPVAALALAVQAAAGGGYGAPAAAAQQQQQQQQRSMDEDSTLDLMSQVLGSRRGGAGGAAEEPTEDISGAAAALGSTRFAAAAASPPRAAGQRQAQPCWAAALLSRALGGSGAAAAAATASGDHPISSLQAEPQQPAPAAPLSAAPAAVQQSAQRSKPQLEEAIAAALGRSTASAATTAAAAPTPAAAPLPAAQSMRAEPPAAPPAAPPAKPAAPLPTPLAPAPPPSALRACPLPPAAPAAAAAAMPAAPVAVPPLRPVEEAEFTVLPTFIRSQLTMQALNATLAAVHSVAAARSSGFTMEDVEAVAGLGAKCKVVVNSLVKLGRVQLQVARGGSATSYLLL